MSERQAAYQLFPELNGDDYAALKADIAERGVMVAVEFDEDGNILDGHHRVRAWTELAYEGVALEPYPRVIREGLTEAQKRAHVRRLNILRRHLTREQKQELIKDTILESPADSNRMIGASLGVAHTTVGRVRTEMETTGALHQSDERVGADGRVINTANIGQRPTPVSELPRTLEEWPMPLPVHEPIEDIDGERYATLPLDDAPYQEPPQPQIAALDVAALPPLDPSPEERAFSALVRLIGVHRLDPRRVADEASDPLQAADHLGPLSEWLVSVVSALRMRGRALRAVK